MKNINRKVQAIFLACSIVLSLFGCIPVCAEAKVECISKEQAKIMAVLKIQYYIANNEKDEVSKWAWGEYVEEPIPMYSLDGKVEAYYVGVINENNESVGYVIVGANKNHAPIIEFGVCNEFYPVKVMKEIEGDKLYYLGSICYMIGKGKKIIDATDFGEVKEVKASSIKNIKVITGDYSKNWEHWENQLKNKHIRIKNNKIEEPSYKAELINRGNSRDVTGYNLPYKVMLSFPGETYHCLPLAGVNLFIYWTNRSSAYSGLRQQNDQFWKRTFAMLKSDMHTNPNSGTSPENGVNGLRTYINRCGIRCFVNYNPAADYTFYRNEIQANRPFIIDYLYASGARHAMLGLGYSNDDAFCIRVVDGDSGYAGRYYVLDNYMLGAISIELY